MDNKPMHAWHAHMQAQKRKKQKQKQEEKGEGAEEKKSFLKVL